VPLLAYLDDSGTHTNDSPVCVAAGYFGSPHYWKLFNLDWGSAISKGRLKEFHASRFWSGGVGGKGYGDYAGWSKEDCEALLAELLNIIRRYRIWPFGSAVVSSDWNALTPDERRYLTGAIYRGGEHKTGGAPNQPYFAAFLFAVQNTAAYCDDGHVVNFVVDESRTLNQYAKEYFQRIKKSRFAHANKLGTIESGDSSIHPGLRAADLMAYLTLKRTREQPEINLEVDVDSALGKAIKKSRNVTRDFKLLGKAAFDRLLEEFRSSANVGGPEKDTSSI
jgi:hypothetical protein